MDRWTDGRMDGWTDGMRVGCVMDDGDTGSCCDPKQLQQPQDGRPPPTTAAAAAATTLRSQTSTLPAKNKDPLFPFFSLSSIFQRFSG